jgi:hypothetical protein
MVQYIWDFWQYLEVEMIRITAFNSLSNMGARFLRYAHVFVYRKMPGLLQ